MLTIPKSGGSKLIAFINVEIQALLKLQTCKAIQPIAWLKIYIKLLKSSDPVAQSSPAILEFAMLLMYNHVIEEFQSHP